MTEVELIRLFQNIKGLDEAKQLYRSLAKSLHPDKGGQNNEFQALNKIYNDYIEQKHHNNDYDIELERIIAILLRYENITIEIIGKWIWLSGNTRSLKDKLKELSFKWASKKKMWYYGEMKAKNPNPKSMEEIKTKYGSETLKSNEKKKIAS